MEQANFISELIQEKKKKEETAPCSVNDPNKQVLKKSLSRKNIILQMLN